MPIGPIKAEAPKLIVNSLSSLRKSYEHIGEFHCSLRTMRGMMELTEKVVLVAFVIIPLAVIAYVAKSLINRVCRPNSGKDSSSLLPGPETVGGPGHNPYMLAEAYRLNGEFDWLLNNLKKELRGERAQKFESDMGKFLADHKKEEQDPSLKVLFTSIRQNQESLQILKAMGRGLFVIPARIQEDGIIREPGDGNCLFHSLRDGMTLQNIEVDPGKPDTIKLEHALRTRIMEWMKDHVRHDETLQGLINQAIEDFIEMKSGQMQIERATAEACMREHENAEKGRKDLVEIGRVERELEEFRNLLKDSNLENRNRRYFEKVGQRGFFGSKAEIYAFSRMYREVRIDVLHKLHDRFLEGYDFSYNEGQSKFITLVYVNGDHFDLQIYKKNAR